MKDGPGRDECLWIAGTERTAFPPMDGDDRADAVVIGGGIVGLTAALQLRRAGCDVLLLEADRVGLGVSARATVKVTVGHGLLYSKIASRHGEDAAAAYGRLNLDGMRLIQELATDCDWEEREHWVWASSPEEADLIAQEVAAENAAGIESELAEATELPFETHGGLRLPGQAQFHPRRYLLGLAAMAAEEGVRIREGTRALDVRHGPPVEVETGRGIARAGHAIVATHYPILNEGYTFAKLKPRREYAVAARIGDTAVPEQMYIGAGKPLRSIRTAPHDSGRLLIAVGEDHHTGERADEGERPGRLAAWVAETFGLSDIVFRWSNQDNDPLDELPLIGEVREGVHIATGFGGWGITTGTGAAMLLAESIAGSPQESGSVFDPRRSTAMRSPMASLRQQTKVGAAMLGDRVRIPVGDPQTLSPGEAAVIRVNGRPAAAHRDAAGALHVVSAVCTHMRCLVRWNEAERSWDCPCHGSRFDPDGHVLHPPAVQPLGPFED